MIPPPYTTAQAASHLSRLLDHLRVGSAAVLGYSHGGAIVQQLVLDHPTRRRRLALACTYAFNMTTFREDRGLPHPDPHQHPGHEAVCQDRYLAGLEAAQQATCRLGPLEDHAGDVRTMR
jgi:pimeloyl-ACP methyl ester carboxylesterase